MRFIYQVDKESRVSQMGILKHRHDTPLEEYSQFKKHCMNNFHGPPSVGKYRTTTTTTCSLLQWTKMSSSHFTTHMIFITPYL
jgi:hypothetical protein